MSFATSDADGLIRQISANRFFSNTPNATAARNEPLEKRDV
jgi:hypothetical protein